MTLITTKILPLTLILAGSVFIAACSSKPSPWAEESQTSSPWDNRAVAEEPTVAEDQIYISEDEVIEPIGYVSVEDDTVMAESMEEAMDEEVVVMEAEELVEMDVIEGGGLAAQPAESFAVQVVASSSMDNLNAFVERNQLTDDWIAETTVDDKVWFVLMSGVYNSKSEADTALAELQDLGTTPWVRTVGSVQAVMN